MNGRRRKLKNFSMISAGAACLFLVESLREMHTVTRVEYRIGLRNLPTEAEGKRIIFFSDYHLAGKGRLNGKIIEKIREFQPDVILVGGDMVSGRCPDIEPATDLLNRLSREWPVYMALGNHEKRLKVGMYDNGQMWTAFCHSLSPDIPVIQNGVQIIPELGGIRLYGLDMELYYYRKKVKERISARELCRLLPEREGVSILLAHDPEQLPAYANWGADLVLSGHYHGGIVRLPFLGGVISPRFTLFPKYDKGIFREKNTQMLVTGGLGQHTLKIRFGNIPEVVGITLTRDA